MAHKGDHQWSSSSTLLEIRSCALFCFSVQHASWSSSLQGLSSLCPQFPIGVLGLQHAYYHCKCYMSSGIWTKVPHTCAANTFHHVPQVVSLAQEKYLYNQTPSHWDSLSFIGSVELSKKLTWSLTSLGTPASLCQHQTPTCRFILISAIPAFSLFTLPLSLYRIKDINRYMA